MRYDTLIIRVGDEGHAPLAAYSLDLDTPRQASIILKAVREGHRKAATGYGVIMLDHRSTPVAEAPPMRRRKKV